MASGDRPGISETAADESADGEQKDPPRTDEGISLPPVTHGVGKAVDCMPSRISSVDDLLSRIKALEDRLEKLESKDASTKISTKENGATTEPSANSQDVIVKPSPVLIPKVRWCNFRQFKSRFSTEEGLFAIDVLLAGQQLTEAVQQEIDRRFEAQERAKFPAPPLTTYDVEDIVDSRTSWLRRVRIQSKFVLRVLAHITSESGIYPLDTETPTTYQEPFKPLIFFHEQVKSALQSAEAKLSSREGDRQGRGNGEDDSGTGQPSSPPENEVAAPEACLHPEASNDRKISISEGSSPVISDFAKDFGFPVTDSDIKELRCYVEFVDDHLMPRFLKFRSDPVREDCPRKVRYHDLYYLFQPGEFVYVPKRAQESSRSGTAVQRVWRVYNIATTRANWKTSEIEKEHQKRRGRDREPPAEGLEYSEENSAAGTTLECYMLDYTGSTFSTVLANFDIPIFDGEVDITSLTVHPLRFLPEKDSLVEELRRQRQDFQSYVKGRKYLAYNGWSMITNVHGDPVWDDNGEPLRHPQHIDSEVIIDFEETFQTNPFWKPHFFFYVAISEVKAKWATDMFAIINYDSPQRVKIVSKASELCEDGFGTGLLEAKRAIQKDRYLKVGAYNSILEWPRHDSIPEEDVILLPTRLFAYSLRDRKFFLANIRSVRPIETVSDPFESLKIESHHKTVVQSLVRHHFAKKAISTNDGVSDLPSQDIIRGKGRGIIILLQGAPGVGKTATAEAVAHHYHRPLFSLTCADLGEDTWEVEQNMKDIFRLAHLWDCILLLDEADIFLSQRRRGDLTMNSLVSVLLRVLEYYDGILFLTTNRPGTLDEAVKSRVHYTLHYNNLSLDQTLDIFKFNLERLKLIEKRQSEATGQRGLVILDKEIIEFARDHYLRCETFGRWNGRQIRNAFQLAASLGHYDLFQYKSWEGQAPQEPQLRRTHFETVAEGTWKYDAYRATLQGKLDEEMARERGDREDNFANEYPTDAYPGFAQGPHPTQPFYGGMGSLPSRDQGAFYHGRQQGYPQRYDREPVYSGPSNEIHARRNKLPTPWGDNSPPPYLGFQGGHYSSRYENSYSVRDSSGPGTDGIGLREHNEPELARAGDKR